MEYKKRIIGIIVCIFILTAGVIYTVSDKEQSLHQETVFKIDSDQSDTKTLDNEFELDTEYEIEEQEQETEQSLPVFIYVYICGQVKHPDVYKIEEGSRVIELISIAGGFTKKAAKESINLARVLIDGEQIYIPSKREQKENTLILETKEQGDNSSFENENIVNLNTATITQLMTLPGIGEAKAQSIIQYREENGEFKTIEDIMKIDGIKEGVFHKIKDRISIN